MPIKAAQARPQGANVHKRLLIRLAVAAVLISVVFGVGMYFFELEKVDETLVDLATAESQVLTDRLASHLPLDGHEPKAELKDLLDTFVAERREVIDGHFVFAELYGRARNKIAESIEPHREYVEKAMDQGGHKFPKHREVWYRKLTIGDEVFLQAVVELRTPQHGNDLEGYFEGVYQVSSDTLAQVTDAATNSVFLVVATVILATLVLYPVVLGLNREVIARSHELLHANINTLEVLGDAIAKRDSDTNVHNYRVTIFAVRLAEALGLDSDTIRSLIKGAFLHDVGKIAISDAILLKPAKLTEDEFTVMKTHVEHGIDIVARSAWMADAVPVVRHHHEKVDGTGYPDGLAGTDIPTMARVFAIADVFDALTSRRPYKEPMSLEKALSILQEGRGRHFDAVMLDAFTALAPDLHRTYSTRADAAIEADLRELTRHYFDDPH